MLKMNDQQCDDLWRHRFNHQLDWEKADLRLDPKRDWASQAEAVERTGIDAVLIGQLIAERRVRQVFIYEDRVFIETKVCLNDIKGAVGEIVLEEDAR